MFACVSASESRASWTKRSTARRSPRREARMRLMHTSFVAPAAPIARARRTSPMPPRASVPSTT
jgi:hypothetical protein